MAPPSSDADPAFSIQSVGVLGAGTMGAGIAQVAAQAGFDVLVYDVEAVFLDRGRQRVAESLGRFESRARITAEDRQAAEHRLRWTTSLDDLAPCDLVVEAVPERLDLKAEVLGRLDGVCGPATLFATNTSSLSVTEIARAARPERTVGMHFFNPPPLLKLVEVVAAETSAEATVQAALAVARRMGKTPVLCRDTPGFVVNRVARPFYLQGLHLLGEGLYDVATIDSAVRDGGFPMGPFQLMDLIGIDVNFAVTRSVYEQRFGEPRFRPHLVQQALLQAGRLGRKSGAGFYAYAAEPPVPAYVHSQPAPTHPPLDWSAWGGHVPAHTEPILGRVLSALVNEAHFALGEGVASRADIDVAMRLGTNYPKGPFEWGDALGLRTIVRTLDALEDWYRDGRHIVAPRLRLAVGGAG